jgi:hypothetical protein
MSDSMKYLGGATDDGEWWADRSSKANDLGPGVSFTVRVADCDHAPPHLICCYGLREDVDLPAVKREVARVIAAYKANNSWWPGEPPIYGELIPPTPEMWKSTTDVLEGIRRDPSSFRLTKEANQRAGKILWSVRDALMDEVGAWAMVDQLIARVGMETFQKIYDDVEVS